MREPPTHPGEMLLKEFLRPQQVTQVEAARRLRISTTRLNAPPGFYERTVPDALFASFDSVPKRFDAIVVDEGQDFLDSWWDPLLLSLADQAGGILYVLHDDNQNLYRRTTSFPGRMLEIPLQDNLRNTQKISELTTKFYRGAPMRALGPVGT